VSDYGIFESIEGSSSEKKIATINTQRKLDAAIEDVKSQYGSFLYASRDAEEWNDRVALCKDDMLKTVNAHLMPVTGVMRRIVKACKDEWRRTADKTGPAMDLKETFSPHDGEDLTPKGDFDAYVDSVDQNSDDAVDNCFREGFYRRADGGVGAAPEAPPAGLGGGSVDPVAQAPEMPVGIPGIQAGRRVAAPGDYTVTQDGGRTLYRDKNNTGYALENGQYTPVNYTGQGSQGPEGNRYDLGKGTYTKSQDNGRDLYRYDGGQGNSGLALQNGDVRGVSFNGKGEQGTGQRFDYDGTNDSSMKGFSDFLKSTGGGAAAPGAGKGGGGTNGQSGSGGSNTTDTKLLNTTTTSGGTTGQSGSGGGGGKANADGTYTVQQGDTLSGIGKANGTDYKDIVKSNPGSIGNSGTNIQQNADLIHPGDVLKGVSGGSSGGGGAATLGTPKTSAKLPINQYIDWCDSMGYRRASINNLDIYATNLNDQAYFEIASALTDPNSPIYVAAAEFGPMDGYGGSGKSRVEKDGPTAGGYDVDPDRLKDELGRRRTPGGKLKNAIHYLDPDERAALYEQGWSQNEFGKASPSGEQPRPKSENYPQGDPAARIREQDRPWSEFLDEKGIRGRSDITERTHPEIYEEFARRRQGSAEEEPTWDTEGLQRDYHVEGFSAPYVVVRRKSDGQRGSLEFNRGSGPGNPRVYRNFVPHHEGRKRTAAPDYLQKADEALTNLLNQKAEEFQETIAPLQQALQTVQQAEQAQQAANPLGVQSPAGTVNVLPGQGDPAAGGGDPSMGGGMPPGGDPSMGGGDPSQQMMARRRFARLHQAKDCKCWDGYKRVPGTKPCAEGSCEKCDTHSKNARRRQAGDFSRIPDSAFRCPECHNVMHNDDVDGHFADYHPEVSHHHSDEYKDNWYNSRQGHASDEGKHRVEAKRGGRGKGRGASRPFRQAENHPVHGLKECPDCGAKITARQIDSKGDASWKCKNGCSGLTDSKGRRFWPNHESFGNWWENHNKAAGRIYADVAGDFDKWMTTRGPGAVENATDKKNFADQQGYGQRGRNLLRTKTGPDALLDAAKPKKTPMSAGGSGATVARRKTRKQADFFTRKVAGWEWDNHLNGYLADKPNAFTCKCGAKHKVPSYSTCKCGKIWNSYVIGTGGDRHQAAVEKFICREIPVRENVIVAQRKKAKGKCECWEGYERVPGTKPCAEGSCRKCDTHRKAMRLVAEYKAGDGWKRLYDERKREQDRVRGTVSKSPWTEQKQDKKTSGKVKRHNLSDPGPLGQGKDDKMPDINEDLGKDWHKRGPGGKYTSKRRSR
jgi:LysM repeat protein